MVAGVACLWWLPSTFENIAHRIATNGEMLRYLGLLAAALLTYDVKVAKSILLPEDDDRNLLQKWDRFGDLKICVWVGMIYDLLFAGLGLIDSLFDWTKPTAFHAVALCVAIAGGIITSGTLILAEIDLRIMLRKLSV
jgi:hypothetical protein